MMSPPAELSELVAPSVGIDPAEFGRVFGRHVDEQQAAAAADALQPNAGRAGAVGEDQSVMAAFEVAAVIVVAVDPAERRRESQRELRIGVVGIVESVTMSLCSTMVPPPPPIAWKLMPEPLSPPAPMVPLEFTVTLPLFMLVEPSAPARAITSGSGGADGSVLPP